MSFFPPHIHAHFAILPQAPPKMGNPNEETKGDLPRRKSKKEQLAEDIDSRKDEDYILERIVGGHGWWQWRTTLITFPLFWISGYPLFISIYAAYTPQHRWTAFFLVCGKALLLKFEFLLGVSSSSATAPTPWSTSPTSDSPFPEVDCELLWLLLLLLLLLLSCCCCVVVFVVVVVAAAVTNCSSGHTAWPISLKCLTRAFFNISLLTFFFKTRALY